MWRPPSFEGGSWGVQKSHDENLQSRIREKKGKSFAKETGRMMKRSGYSDGEIAEMLKL
jgi:hypothetical protein